MSNRDGAFPEPGTGGPASPGETVPNDLAASVPAPPIAGSSLDALVRRQVAVVRAGQWLGFVPAQVC